MPASAVTPARASGNNPAILLAAKDIRRTFVRSGGFLRPTIETQALRGVSFEVRRGEILGVVGESGCGKSTLARIVVGLERADGGSLTLENRRLFGPGAPSLPPSGRGIQMVFQDPYGSLNPRMRVADLVGEGLAIAGVSRAERAQRVAEALRGVGLRPADGERYPHQFSGGQRQRIAIARALTTRPRLLIADEAVSALDVSVQMQILNLLLDIRDRFDLTILFITHDLGVVEYLCDRVIVLSQGEIVERGDCDAVLTAPRHPYTQRLLAAVPDL